MGWCGSLLVRSHRVCHLKDGDAHTTFFHKQASFRKRKNFIAKLVVEDEVFTAQQDKHNVLFEYFDGILVTAVQRTTSASFPPCRL